MIPRTFIFAVFILLIPSNFTDADPTSAIGSQINTTSEAPTLTAPTTTGYDCEYVSSCKYSTVRMKTRIVIYALNETSRLWGWFNLEDITTTLNSSDIDFLIRYTFIRNFQAFKLIKDIRKHLRNQINDRDPVS